MNYGRLVAVIANTNHYERRYCKPSTLASIAFMRTLDDGTLVNVAQMAEPYWSNLCAAVGPDKNPYWVQGRAAEIAWERLLIGDNDLDRLTR